MDLDAIFDAAHGNTPTGGGLDLDAIFDAAHGNNMIPATDDWSWGGEAAATAAGYLKGLTALGSTPIELANQIYENIPGVKKSTPYGAITQKNIEAFGLDKVPEAQTTLGYGAQKAAEYLPGVLSSGPGTLLSKAGLLATTTGGALAGQSIGGNVGEAVGAIAGAFVPSKISQFGAWAKESGPKLQRASTGARISDYNKDANELGLISVADGEIIPRTQAALDDLLSSGQLGKSRDPSDLLNITRQNEKGLASSVSKIIHSADEQLKGASVKPTFENALQYLSEGKVPADQVEKYLSRLEKLSDGIQREGGGRLPYIQQQKIAIGKSYDPHDGVLNGFNRSLYSDLQKTIEEVAPEVAPLNKELQKWEVVKKIFQRTSAGEAAGNPIKEALQRRRTSGGWGNLPIVGSVLGGVPGWLAGETAAFGLSKLASPTGVDKTGRFLNWIGPKASLSPQSNISDLFGIGAIATNPGSEFSAASSLGDPSNLFQPADEKYLQSRDLSHDSQIDTESPEVLLKPVAKYDRSYKTSDKDTQAQQRSPSETRNKEVSLLNSVISDLFSVPTANAATLYEDNTEGSLMSELFSPKGIAAVIKQESGGKQSAVSPKGAQGLMQLMPATAKEVAAKLGETYDPTDAAQNVRLGTQYLRDMYGRFGDEKLALAAYNYGPNALQKLINKYGASFDKIEPHLPAETKKYVKNISTNLGLA